MYLKYVFNKWDKEGIILNIKKVPKMNNSLKPF